MLALFASAAVFASEAAVKETIMEYSKANAQFDVKAAEYLAADFSGMMFNRKITRDDSLNTLKRIDIMLKTDDLEVFMENALLMKGEKLSDEQRQQIRGIKNTDEGKKYLQQGKQQIEQLKKVFADGLKKLVFKGCKITGNSAVVDAEMASSQSDKIFNIQYTLVKSNGKWLISAMSVSAGK